MKRLIKTASNLDSMEVADLFNSVFKDIPKILKDGLNLSDNFDENLNKYKQFNNCKLKTFFDMISTSPLANEISNKLDEDFNSISEFVQKDVICKNACENWLKDVMHKIHNTPSLTNQYVGFGNSVDKITSAKDLKDLDDKINQVTKLTNFIDFTNRDKGWLIIYPDQFLETSKGESHTELITRWCEENGIDFSTEKTKERLNKEELKDVDINKCSFGHIVSNMAFIDDIDNGMTVNESLTVLEKHGYDKIYEYNQKEKFVRRLK